MTRILSGITFLNLEDISFLFLVDEDDYEDYDPDDELWLELDGILARPQFSKLTKVSITLVLLTRANEFYRQWFVDHLPQCHARGILEYHVDYRMASLETLAKWK